MTRLMDIGLERLENMILDMASHAQNTIQMAIDAYINNENLSQQIFQRSEEERMLQDEISELSVEMLARYQPLASDLRFIKACMEVSYGFSRFERYAYDISQIMSIYGDISSCDKSSITKAGIQANEMIKLSIQAFKERNTAIARKIIIMDDIVDEIYSTFVKQSMKEDNTSTMCIVSITLILRYLERIADHATYIAESVIYIKTGERSVRK
tara:strand:+ start:217 stop:852 length:636 start_codon:yes stop_codon:yes gene_type:complete